MFRSWRFRIIAAILIATIYMGILAIMPSSPVAVANSQTTGEVCVKALGPHVIPPHEIKAYTRKGIYHPAHWSFGGFSNGRRAFCYFRKGSSGHRHHRAFCVRPRAQHWSPDHMSRPYTRKGVFHPSHFVHAHEVSARRAYCVKAA